MCASIGTSIYLSFPFLFACGIKLSAALYRNNIPKHLFYIVSYCRCVWSPRVLFLSSGSTNLSTLSQQHTRTPLLHIHCVLLQVCLVPWGSFRVSSSNASCKTLSSMYNVACGVCLCIRIPLSVFVCVCTCVCVRAYVCGYAFLCKGI